MEPRKLERIRLQLHSLREKAMEEVTSLERGALNTSPRERAGDLSGYGIHLADAASDAYDRDFNLSLVSLEQGMLKDIDAALAKIEGGAYGICELCGEAINESRLSAVPYARLCLHCKQHQEKKQSYR